MKKSSLIGVLITGLVLSACGTTQTKQAPIVEQSTGPAAPAAPAAQTAPGPQVETHGLAPGATTQIQPLAASGPGVVGVDAADAAALHDPNNILSKRIIYFDFDQYDVKPEYQALIAAHAAFLRKHPDARVVLQGNTDDRGSREYNMALGQRRADAVRQALAILGVHSDQMETISFGEEKPAVPGNDEAAWAKDRRTVIQYQGE